MSLSYFLHIRRAHPTEDKNIDIHIYSSFYTDIHMYASCLRRLPPPVMPALSRSWTGLAEAETHLLFHACGQEVPS